MAELPPLDWQGLRTPHYTQVPDEVFDVLMAYLSGAEFKVLCYIVRHTFGWKKDVDAISLSQIMGGITRRDGTRVDHGTGLSKAGAVAAIKRLEELHIIEAIRHASPERGHEPTTYRPILALSANQTSYPDKLDEGGLTSGQALVQSADTQETPVQDTLHKNGSGTALQEAALTAALRTQGRAVAAALAAWHAAGCPPYLDWLQQGGER